MKKIFILGAGGFFKEQFYWLKDTLKNKNNHKINAIATNKVKLEVRYI